MLQIKSFTVNMFQENTYLLFDETKSAVLVDCGALYPEEQNEILHFVEHQGIRVELLLNTHAHIDHIFGNDWAAQTFGLSPCIPEGERDFYLRADEQLQLFFNQRFELPLPDPGRLLRHGDKLSFGAHKLEVISCAGHSPDGLCFYCPEAQVLLSGDSLFRESIGRTDLPGGNHMQLLTAVRDRLLTLPPTTVVYPGHGPSTTIAHECTHNPYF